MRVTHEAYAVEGWGVGELWIGDGRVVLAHEAPRAPRGAAGPPTGILTAESLRGCAGFVPDLVRRIHTFFAGEQVSFADVELDLEWCTPFQRSLAEALQAVPWGETISYGELAERAGAPRAARAAGTFCAGNKHFLFLACHRVVAADGLGSYGSDGLGVKRRLLRLEGHAL